MWMHMHMWKMQLLSKTVAEAFLCPSPEFHIHHNPSTQIPWTHIHSVLNMNTHMYAWVQKSVS
jgi:hypothetical protein